DLSLYPNPGTGYYKCEINTPVNNKVSVRIMNILGVKIMEKILTPENGNIRTTINIKDFPDGMYVIEVNDGNQKLVKSLIKN
ncbi:MAG: T9SS type A sorting domain-containing protein, partial [Bacteroidota bacterium]|nr:T9SS type A sorting domain-containing protein [Bacteroidota bacterium]